MRAKIILLFYAVMLGACAVDEHARRWDDAPPRLFVVVTVDQMRDDQLDLYRDFYRGGFRRLADGGHRFINAWVDHAPTNSSPGHATIATGAYPRRHGVVDNSWKEKRDGEWVRVYADELLPGDCKEGDEERFGALGALTLGERLLAQGGKFAAISAGREIARLYAGRASAPVIWLSPEGGGFRTSRCYLEEPPSWLRDFNDKSLPDFVSDRWTLSIPNEMLTRLRSDDSPFENEGKAIAFPHQAPADAENPLLWFYDTPNADEAALALASVAIEAEGLGADATPDLLDVVINTIDNVGHDYGPFSVEQADNLYRLDAALGAFMEDLDRLVGKRRWVLVLTADHGAPPAPEAREAASAPTARRVSEEEVAAVVTAAHAAADRFDTDDPARLAAIIKEVESFDFIDAALTPARIRTRAAAGDKIGILYEHSLIDGKISRHPFYDSDGRGLAEFGIIPLLAENVVVDWATSVHGSPYDYDRKVPMVFYGGCVSAGNDEREMRTVDIAPTLAALMEIKAPASAFDGRSVTLGCAR